MAKQTVGLGSSANDGNGDTLRTGGTKINANFDEIYAEFGNGTALSSANTQSDILVADGTKWANVTTSGDINISNTGAINLRGNSLTVGVGSAPGTTTNKLYNVGGTLYWNGTAVGVAGGSAISAFNITGDSGTAQSVNDGNTITIAGGTGIASVASATDTITLNIDATVATLTGTQTFTNKTLTTPIIASLKQSGSNTLTMPAATDTLVGKATTDTLTNKTIDADGTGNSITNIENANIKAAAAIAVNKLAAATASRALVSDSNGFLSAATTTAAEIGYVNGVTSSIQTQLGTKHTSGASLDMNGTELILDADADTSITADTDDQIDIRIGGADLITLGAGVIDLKNAGSVSNIKFYCESSNAHYTALQSSAHSAYSGNVNMTLPASNDTLVGKATTDILTNKTMGTLTGSVETVTGDGSGTDAIALTTLTSYLNTSGGTSSLTLATGTTGQIKIITMITAGNAATLTTTNGNLLAGQVANSITFDAVGETATLLYNGTKWIVTSIQGATIG